MAGGSRILIRGVLLGFLPALVAGGLWRLDRDQPLWRQPGLWGLPRARAASPPLPPLVLAVHYPWYGTPRGPARRWRHWNHPRLMGPEGRILGFHTPGASGGTTGAARPALGSTHVPAGGPYDSEDPTLIRAQLLAGERAGIGAFVVSWWGRESPEARVFARLLAEARPTSMRLAPYYETGELWRRGAPGVAADLEALLDRHGRDPAWLRVGEVPVVFLYAAHRLRLGQWDYVVRRLAAGGRRAFLVTDAPSPDWLRARPGWLARFEALHVFNWPVTTLARGRDLTTTYRAFAELAHEAGVPFVPAVTPGFDDRTIRHPGTVVPRDGGATYDRTWEAALAVSPAWVLIVSWNEWHEGSEIEASREHGPRYLEATQAWSARLRAGVPPRSVSP